MYPGFDPSPLKAFLAALGVPYYFISEGIIEMAGEHMTRDSICAWCSVSCCERAHLHAFLGPCLPAFLLSCHSFLRPRRRFVPLHHAPVPCSA